VRPVLFVLGVLLLAACPGGRDALLADLLSDRPERRALALHKLGEQGRESDLVLFTRAAHDPASIVRGEAATALGHSGEPEVAPVLSELVEDSDEAVQAKAVAALAKIPGDKPRAYLILQYPRRGRATREAIVATLQASGLKDAATQLVEGEARRLWESQVKVLSNGTPAERVNAAETLGRSGRPEAVDLLMSLVKDSQISTAAAALRGLGLSQDRRAIPPLVASLAESHPDLRDAGVEGLVRLSAVEGAPALLALAREGSASSANAVRALTELPRSPERDAELCALALEAGPEVATLAAQGMRRRGGCPLTSLVSALGARAPRARLLPTLHVLAGLGKSAHEAAPTVVALLTSKDPEVVVQSVRTLGELGDASARAAILGLYQAEWKRLSSAREDWVKTDPPRTLEAPLSPLPGSVDPRAGQMEELMGRLRAQNAARRKEAGLAPALPSELVEDVDFAGTQLAATALQALGRLDSSETLSLARRHLDDGAPPLAEAALLAAVHCGKEGLTLVKSALGRTSADQREALAQALVEQGDPGKQGLLDLATHSPTSAPVQPFLAALMQVGAPADSAPALEALLQRGGPEAAAAAHLLGQLRAQSAVPLLLATLQDQTNVARRDSLWALGQIGDRHAAEAVGKELFHESPEVRGAAAQALIRLGSEGQRPILTALTRDYFLTVREQAKAALAAQAVVSRP
jgi:HEAT repeat protein